MKKALATITLLLLSTQLWAATVEGRLVRDGEPVAGVRVAAYKTLDFSAEPAALAEPTAADGGFRLDLPAGEYAFFLHNRNKGLFAFCGRNPVTVADEPVWVGLQAVPLAAAGENAYDSEYSGAVEGRVYFEGKPLAGGVVYLYLDVAEDLKGQGYRRSVPTGADGFFAFDELPESDYFLVARKRNSGARVGPVLEGDLLGVSGSNPLPVKAGKVVKADIHLVRKAREMPEDETVAGAGGLTVSGRVIDGEGRPVSGVHVFAYTDRIIGHQRPAALSAPTGSDGSYVLALPEAGTYYVGARERYGDSPAPGELFGMYDETADHGLKATGDLDGIVIAVEPVSLQ